MVMVPAEMEADPAVMAQLVLQLKGLLLEYEARLQAALVTSTNAEMRSLATQLAAVQGQVDELMAKPLKEQSAPAAVAAFGRAIRQKQKLRAEAFSLMGEVRTNEPATATVAAQLPPGTALVEFMHYGRDTGNTHPVEARYGALVLKRDGNPQMVPIGKFRPGGRTGARIPQANPTPTRRRCRSGSAASGAARTLRDGLETIAAGAARDNAGAGVAGQRAASGLICDAAVGGTISGGGLRAGLCDQRAQLVASARRANGPGDGALGGPGLQPWGRIRAG